MFSALAGFPTQRGYCTDPLTPLGWLESIEGGFQSLNPRSWRSSRQLRGCRERLLTQNALRGSGTARHLGPTPRGGLKFGCEHVCRTRTARNRRVKDARRSVAGPPSAVLARSLRVAHFGVRGRRREFWRARGPPRILPAYRVGNRRVSAARSPA